MVRQREGAAARPPYIIGTAKSVRTAWMASPSRWHLNVKFLLDAASSTWCTATRPSMEPTRKPVLSGKAATLRVWYFSGLASCL